MKEKFKSENLQKEENHVIEFFTDPVYAYNPLYGINGEETDENVESEELNE